VGTLFLQESDATILLADILDFTQLAKEKGATVELAITLSRFYEAVAAAAVANGGRVIKLVGDGVLCAFVGTKDHRIRALRAMKQLVDGRAAHNAGSAKTGMPEIEYSVVCTSGRVLAGDLGAAKLQGFDVIGATVNRAFRLSHIATKRRASHLVEASTIEGIPEADRPAVRALESGSFEAEEYALFELA
jgi:adenylate cyclase